MAGVEHLSSEDLCVMPDSIMARTHLAAKNHKHSKGGAGPESRTAGGGGEGWAGSRQKKSDLPN